MRSFLAVVVLLLVPFLAMGVLRAAEEPPAWAYAISPPPPPGTPPAQPAPPDPTLRHVAGSNLSFTLAQIRDAFGPADWFPGDHPTMPEVVARGRKQEKMDVRACALCHYPNGKGRPENAPVAGLPYGYFVQQMNDFKNGLRKSADSRKTNTNNMADFAKFMTDDEVKAAAEYFSSMKWTPWIRVVESSTVPKTRLAGGMYLRIENGGTEPLGQRILETPENVEATETLRDPRSGFVAFVPPGSVKKGENLVKTGAGRTTECGVCHGTNLQGLGPVPGIAGRSPSYLVRQMYDMQQGSRKGTWTELMKPVVAKLTNEDMLNIAAYTASLMPTTAPATR